MDFSVPKVVCGVCHGKGGFRKLKKDFLDINWIDCPYCEGYGFVDDNTTYDECKQHLLYDKYKNYLTLEFQLLGNVKVFTSETEERDIYLRLSPFNGRKFSQLLKHLLKYSLHSDTVNIMAKRVFILENEEDGISDDCELFITLNKITDLDGVLELVKFFNEIVI